MLLEKFIEECLGLWPDEISMVGAKYIPQSKGYLFPELIKVHDKLQDKIKDHLVGVVMYEIYGMYFYQMKELYNKGIFLDIKKSEIEFEKLIDNVKREVLESENEELKEKFKSFSE